MDCRMGGVVLGFRSRPEKLRRDEREQLRTRPLVDLLDDPAVSDKVRRVASQLEAEIDVSTASKSGWPFIMLSPDQHLAVVRFLRTVRRSQIANEVWAVCYRRVHRTTHEIMLSRDEIAAEVGVPADDVSRIMSELARFGAVIAKRVPVSGMRGPGVVRYFMNPNVATHVPSSRALDEARARAPVLKLVDASARPTERRSRAAVPPAVPL